MSKRNGTENRMNTVKYEPKTAEKRTGGGEILALLNARDEAGAEAMARLYGTRLKAFAARFLSDGRDQEEVVNDALLKAWQAIPPAQPESLEAFLMTLTRRAAISRLRRLTRKSEVPQSHLEAQQELEEVLGAANDTESEAAAAELSRILNAYLAGLPRRDRVIFLERYYGSRSLSEIARLFGLSRSTVDKTLKRVRDGLREKLESEGYTP